MNSIFKNTIGNNLLSWLKAASWKRQVCLHTLGKEFTESAAGWPVTKKSLKAPRGVLEYALLRQQSRDDYHEQRWLPNAPNYVLANLNTPSTEKYCELASFSHCSHFELYWSLLYQVNSAHVGQVVFDIGCHHFEIAHCTIVNIFWVFCMTLKACFYKTFMLWHTSPYSYMSWLLKPVPFGAIYGT